MFPQPYFGAENGRVSTARLTQRVRPVGTNAVAIIGALGPVTTIAFGWLGLEEVMTPLQIAGSVLVLIGVVVISLRPRAEKA